LASAMRCTVTMRICNLLPVGEIPDAKMNKLIFVIWSNC